MDIYSKMDDMKLKFFSDAIFKDKRIGVKAKTPEKAAMKLYKHSKIRYGEIGFVKVFSEDLSQIWIFKPEDWLRKDGKFWSKPKKDIVINNHWYGE